MLYAAPDTIAKAPEQHAHIRKLRQRHVVPHGVEEAARLQEKGLGAPADLEPEEIHEVAVGHVLENTAAVAQLVQLLRRHAGGAAGVDVVPAGDEIAHIVHQQLQQHTENSACGLVGKSCSETAWSSAKNKTC